MSNGPRQRGMGTIGILSGPFSRYAAFTIALLNTLKPPDTRLEYTQNTDIVGNMNLICRNMRGDWLWILGDDHVWEPDLLARLMAHDVDVVVPLCLTRTAPFAPVVYSGEVEEGVYASAHDLPAGELVQVHAAGSAGMLVKRRVLDAIGDPWFSTDGTGMNEDLTFCRKVRDAGFDIYCDTSALLGHIGTMTVWPTYQDEKWKVELDVGNGNSLTLDYLPKPELAVVA